MKQKLLAILLLISLKNFAQNRFLDSTFSEDGLAINNYSKFDEHTCIALQQGGKIVAGGTYELQVSNNSVQQVSALMRYNTNGKIDSSFGINGLVYARAGRNYSNFTDVVILSDGKIIAVASAVNTYQRNFIALYRFNANGNLDSTFANNGIGRLTDSILAYMPNALSIQSDGKIIVAGTIINKDDFIPSSALITRFNKNGSFDKTFADSGKQVISFGNKQTVGNGLAVVNDDIYVIAAIDTRINAGDYDESIGLIKLSKNGAFDNSFGTGGKALINPNISFFGEDIIVRNNYIIIGGSVLDNYKNFLGVARLSLTGKLDSSFGNNGFATIGKSDEDDLYAAIALQQDEKIIVAGNKIETVPPYRNATYIVRFNENGIPDNSFGNNGSIITYIQNNHGAATNDMLIQPDGKILAAGRSYTTRNNNDFVLIRYKNLTAAQSQTQAASVNKKLKKIPQLTQ